MLKAYANAKINWALAITGRRDDGYHEMDMLMQSISLHDTLTFEEGDALSLSVDGGAPIWDDKNLVCRAAELLRRETGCRCGAAITLKKRIPARAGLGGGSADGAAALRALNRLWALHLSEERLLELGLSLGADFPFCLTGGLQRVQGIGEKLTKLRAHASPELILAMPDEGLSTGAVFQAFDAAEGVRCADMDAAQAALLSGDYARLKRYAVNHLTRPAETLSAAVERAIADFYAAGALFAAMSGSGSCVFGVFDEPDAAFTALRARYPLIFRAQTRETGVEFV